MSESPHHAVCLARLEEVLEAERFAVSELILAAVVRIATNRRVWKKPASSSRAFDFVEGLREHPGAVRITPGPRHWRLFRDLATATGCRGADTTDAYLAALALEHGCEWWTADAGFARFKGLRWRNVLTT
jgi:toxin-antitoxin system PIN domain toxin